MKKSTKIALIAVSLLAAAGAVYYFVIKPKKDKKEADSLLSTAITQQSIEEAQAVESKLDDSLKVIVAAQSISTVSEASNPSILTKMKRA